MRLRRRPRHRPPPEPDTESVPGPLPSDEIELSPVGQTLSDAVGIDSRSRVMKYQPLYSRVTELPDGITLHFAQLTVKATPDHKDALHFVSKSIEPFEVCDLPGLSAAQQTELARALIVNGFLVRLPD